MGLPHGFELADGVGSTVRLRDGNRMPVLGFGVWQIPAGAATRRAVRAALDAGYRHVDTAALYGNEADVGAAIRESRIPRRELFVTTKLWNDDQGYDRGRRAFERSRANLGDEVIDLYLVHWPVRGVREESWRALVDLQREGKVRSIGVSNFTVAHLESLARTSGVVPAVDQVEFSPFLYQSALLEYCQDHGIQLEAWSPLVRGRRFDDPTLRSIAERRGRTPAQIILRWDLQRGVVPLPKSATPERIASNAQLFDFELDAEELRRIDGLDQGSRTGWNPDQFG